jgi:hypothetical protein
MTHNMRHTLSGIRCPSSSETFRLRFRRFVDTELAAESVVCTLLFDVEAGIDPTSAP